MFVASWAAAEGVRLRHAHKWESFEGHSEFKKEERLLLGSPGHLLSSLSLSLSHSAVSVGRSVGRGLSLFLTSCLAYQLVAEEFYFYRSSARGERGVSFPAGPLTVPYLYALLCVSIVRLVLE